MRFDWCKANLHVVCEEHKYEHCEMCNIARAYVHGYETAQEDTPKTEWIPVSERLPSDSGNYLITVADLRLGHNGEHTVTIADFYAKGKKWNSVVDVVAWMPLPDPWKDGEEK